MARRVLVLASVVLFAAPLIAAECIKVRTKAPHNPEASVWYHVPKGYDAARRKPYPVLVYFGGRNCTGKREASGALKWDKWCEDIVERSRRIGINIIWRSFPNHPHDVPPDSLVLARAFILHHLGGGSSAAAPFVGDDQENVYYPADAAEATFVPTADRVLLPSRAVAEAWGRAAAASGGEEADGGRVERFSVDGVEFVCRIPAVCPTGSRVVVLFGGRNWPGSRTVKAFGFDALADRMGLVLLSPSFSDGEYWRPETGTGETLAKAVGEVEGRCGLKRSKVFLYGYSAGGQCAALFAAHMKDRVAAWGAHACGVYPDVVPANGVPALVTCGVDDTDRLRISRIFAYRYRDGGGELVFKTYSCGHELPAAALSLAGAWLESLLDGGGFCAYGEDDTRQIASRDDIDPEFRNPFRTTRLMALWLK